MAIKEADNLFDGEEFLVKDLFKGNKPFLNSINQYMKDKALVESRRKVSNKIADIYLRHGNIFAYLLNK